MNNEIIMETLDDDKYKLSKQCIKCKQEITIGIMPIEKVRKLIDVLENDRHIQELDWLSPDSRELFISGLCGKCFDKIFADEED